MSYIPQKGIKDKTENIIMSLLHNDAKAFSNTLNVACCSGVLILKKGTEELKEFQRRAMRKIKVIKQLLHSC